VVSEKSWQLCTWWNLHKTVDTDSFQTVTSGFQKLFCDRTSDYRHWWASVTSSADLKKSYRTETADLQIPQPCHIFLFSVRGSKGSRIDCNVKGIVSRDCCDWSFRRTTPSALIRHPKKQFSTLKVTPWCIHFRGVSIPRCIHLPEVSTPRCIHHRGVTTSTPWSIHCREVATARCIQHRVESTTQCVHYRGVINSTPWYIYHEGGKTPRCIHHRGVETSRSNHRFYSFEFFKGLPRPVKEQSLKKWTTGDYFHPLARGPWLESSLLSSPSDRLPSGEYTGESLSKTSNSSNILYTPKLLVRMFIRARRSGLMKKQATRKMSWRYHVPTDS
jgi:hypothetical protein